MISDQRSVLRVRHDAWTRLLYLQLGAFAFFLYAFSPSISLLRDDLHISAAVAGLHSTTYAAGVTLGGLTAPGYIARSGGSRPAIWLGLVGLSSAIALFCAVPLLAVTLTAAFVCGVFGSYLCIAIPAALSNAHGAQTGPAAITEANAVAAAVGIGAPLLVGGADAAGFGWRSALLAVLPLSLLLFVVMGRVREFDGLGTAVLEEIVIEDVDASLAAIPEPRAELSGAEVIALRLETAVPAGHGTEPEWRTLSRLFWINQIAGVCVGAIEFSLTLWCATLLRDRAHISPGIAATGVTAIVAGMAAGRSAGGRLALRFSMDRLLFAAFGLNLLGFALFWLTAAPAAMFAGLAVAGLGMSLEFPLVSARAINLAEGRAELAGAVNMFGSGLAIGGAPFLLGFMSDRIGIHAAYLLVPVLIGTAIAALYGSRTSPSERPSAVLASESMAA